LLAHQIETSGKPIWQAVRRIPIPHKQEVKKLLSEMRQKDIIVPSHVTSLTFRNLHRTIRGHLYLAPIQWEMPRGSRKGAYPIPRIDDALDTLAGS